MAEQFTNYFELCFTMPVLPATLLMLVILGYVSLVLLGALDFELFDLDIDVDLDLDADVGALSNIGMLTLKFLNLADVPIMIWLSLFGLAWWGLSQLLWMIWDVSSLDPNMRLLVFRNVAVAVFATKFMTNPLAKGFAKPKQFKPEQLLGQKCEITTYEATEEFGQAKFQSEAAPILLDVRTNQGSISKGSQALIVDYDPESKIHYLDAISDPP